MSPSSDVPHSLQVRCPSCDQRFKVGEDLRGRVVECGACEHQFRIDDESIVKAQRFYPGEKRDPSLDAFARVASQPSVGNTVPEHVADVQRVSFEPSTPLRPVAGIAAILGMIGAGALLGFGNGYGSILDGAALSAKLAIAIFAGLAGTALLVYANPNSRIKAVLVALVFTTGLISLPFLIKETPRVEVAPEVVEKTEIQEDPSKEETAESLAAKIRLGPLTEESARRAAEGQGKTAIGIWLRGMDESSKYLVRDYIVKTTEAESTASHLYPREAGEWLMVLSGSPKSVEEIEVILLRLGGHEESTVIHPELNVIEVNVDNGVFQAGPVEKLSNKDDPAFYDLNRHELKSIEPDRILKAVDRLSGVEPKLYRDDISKLLIHQVKNADAPLLSALAKALKVWTRPDDQVAIDAMKTAVEKMHENGQTLPKEAVDFLVSRHVTAIAPILDELWAANFTEWEKLYGELGPVIEPLVLKRLETSQGFYRHSAVRLLGIVGTTVSLGPIEKIHSPDPELRVIIDRSVAAIRARQ